MKEINREKTGKEANKKSKVANKSDFEQAS